MRFISLIKTTLVFSFHITRYGLADAVGTVAFHPFKPLLLSASGARHFRPSGLTEANSSSSSDYTTDDEVNDPTAVRRQRQLLPRTLDSSVKLWRFASSDLPNNGANLQDG